MNKKYIISLDQGTTSCRTIIYDKNGSVISSSQKEFTQYFPKSGWVEHNAMEIWHTQCATLIEAVNLKSINVDHIAGIGTTNQRETVVAWNKKTGLPICPAIVWQDRRTADFCKELINDEKTDFFRKKTGLVIDAYFSATKIKWIIENIQQAKELLKDNNLLVGTIDTWLVYKLTNHKVHITDATNASRTMLFNIKDRKWDSEILKLLNIPRSILPEVKNSSEIYGYFELPLFKTLKDIKIPIASAIGDQQAALFGQKCFLSGDVKNTYGTGCFILVNTGEKIVYSKNGLLTTIALSIDNKIQYALEGSVFIAGAGIQWLRDNLRIIYNSEQSEWYANMAAKKNQNRVFVVPAFTGLGAPYWDSYARGAIFGIERDTKREDIIKATLEAIAYSSKDILETMKEDIGYDFKNIKVDGGASQNNYLMQFQADLFSKTITRPKNLESTALGAAFLAGLAVKFWTWSDIKNINETNKTVFSPKISEDNASKLHTTWKKVIKKTLNWVNEIK
ncbi:glycerol kinase GlpK [Mycoplasma sp. SG1]|uniref:glycerol kinase GlpK n=1 Tax=Mycoplasma sp. SG1 TaxID=2810348 RepID=UPI0020258766|nr:glycerol kinase GlpK [Mycoplasma sp. SG1]URM53133.1 glycerol kinase GlpK [Mycoplasma sp. SG1]